MRYLILRPASSGRCSLDPHHLPDYESTSELHAAFPVEVECKTEHEARHLVRLAYPNAVTMPIPVKVGSGMTFILGVLESIEVMPEPPMSDRGGKIPFVMFVQAVSENADERQRLAKQQARVYSRGLWRIPVTAVVDEYIGTLRGEVRTSALEQPIPVQFAVSITEDERIMFTGKMLETEQITVLFDRKHLANVIAACEGAAREESQPQRADHGGEPAADLGAGAGRDQG